jgi:hypothetical protein
MLATRGFGVLAWHRAGPTVRVDPSQQILPELHAIESGNNIDALGGLKLRLLGLQPLLLVLAGLGRHLLLRKFRFVRGGLPTQIQTLNRTQGRGTLAGGPLKVHVKLKVLKSESTNLIITPAQLVDPPPALLRGQEGNPA